MNELPNIVKELKQDFEKVKQQGFIESRRFHDTGIGKTFEDFMKIAENNDKSADYKGLIELKSARKLSEAMVTLSTKSPDPRGINSKLRAKFGYPDVDFPNITVLHTTFSGDKFNNSKGKFGFKLSIDFKQRNISIIAKDLQTDKIDDSMIAYYPFEKLKKIIDTKLKYIAFIETESKKENGKEFFRFNNIKLLSGLTFEKFLEFIEKGIIKYDFRLGVFKTGKLKGKNHDHGSGFRILKGDIGKVFTITKLD